MNASLKERREMLEDALGLKIYQLKHQEAERKLERTKENINQVESLRKEIQPHLKFLKKQAEKIEKALSLKDKLKDVSSKYFSKEEKFLKRGFSRLALECKKPFNELASLEKKINSTREELEKEGEKFPASSELINLESELEDLRSKRLAFERDLGRWEGIIEVEEKKQKETIETMIERAAVEKFLEKLTRYLEEGFLRLVFEKIQKAVEEFSNEIKFQKQTALAAELETLKKKRDEISSSLEALRQKEKELVGKLSEAKLELEKKEQFRRNTERELYNAELSASNLRNVLKSFEIEEEKLKARKEEIEAEKQAAVHFLGAEIVVKDVAEDDFSLVERDQLRREIERLKIRLEDTEGIGDDVLKEYQQVKSRDEFFTKELDDLERAAKSLIDLMKELTEKIDHDFKNGVSAINKEFQSFFALMFGGGTAELKVIKIEKRGELGEASEGIIEEEGIEISVNLPRKRIRSLDMLSGGERALTSIALLFAMTQVNPPPFLVLDEVDVALDESNSQKYAEMLKDLSKRTQLILVTHNRETMKQAGILYGVTMGSSGASQILSIKFKEAEELAAQDKT